MKISPLSQDELRQLKGLLNKCTPGALPSEVFNTIGRLVVYPAIELVPLRVSAAGRIEVLLLKRKTNDPVWPSMFHMPGTVIRPTDDTLEQAMSRVIRDELGGMTVAFKVPLGIHLNRNQRGNGLQIEYVIKLDGVPQSGTYYDLDSLPPKFITEQIDSLIRGVTKYRQIIKNDYTVNSGHKENR